MSFTLDHCPETLTTTGLNLSLCGLWTIPGTLTSPGPSLTGVTGPRPGITALKWNVITTNFTHLGPVTEHVYQLFFNPITAQILFTVSMLNYCLEWHLECSNKTGRLSGYATIDWWNSKNVFQFTAWISMAIKISYIQVPKSLDGSRISPSRD